MSIKENIKKLRTTAGLTQQKLAEMSGLATTQISALENTNENPSIETIIKIAKALNCSITDIVNDPISKHLLKDDSGTYGSDISRIIYLLKKHPNSVKLILNELSFIDKSNEVVSMEHAINAVLELSPEKRKALLALLG